MSVIIIIIETVPRIPFVGPIIGLLLFFWPLLLLGKVLGKQILVISIGLVTGGLMVPLLSFGCQFMVDAVVSIVGIDTGSGSWNSQLYQSSVVDYVESTTGYAQFLKFFKLQAFYADFVVSTTKMLLKSGSFVLWAFTGVFWLLWMGLTGLLLREEEA